MEIRELNKMWIDSELRLQKNKLRALEASPFSKKESFKRVYEMRKELVAICEKYANAVR